MQDFWFITNNCDPNITDNIEHIDFPQNDARLQRFEWV